MTLVNIDLRNQGYETGPDDRVIFYSLLVREGDFGTISTAPVEVPLVDGKGSKDLAPGPVGVQIIAGQVADTRVRAGEVPPSGPTTLNAVMMVTPAYTPALQKMMIAAVERAREIAVARVEGVAASTVNAAHRAEIAAGEAERAKGAAVTSAETAVTAATQTEGDRTVTQSHAALAVKARDQARVMVLQAQLTTVGVNLTEAPPGSGLWVLGGDTLELIESAPDSGLYAIGVV